MDINLNKKILFRADASITLGNGHIMRCLALASEFKAHGAECVFICKELTGNAIEFIRSHGFDVYSLPSEGNQIGGGDTLNEDSDALQSINYLKSWFPDLVIVDHYSLGHIWEHKINHYCRNLMVIDDLANRFHECVILLDQGLMRKKEDYSNLVPESCHLLVGQHYSMLRHEFSQLRPYSLKRRIAPKLKNILVTMGGTDQPNATGCVLEGLIQSKLPTDCLITIIMGSNAPWIDKIKHHAQQLPYETKVLINASNMATLMAESDLAIGAVGGTAWERCCLGLPTLMVILADNQKEGAFALESCGAAKLLGTPEIVSKRLPTILDELIETPLLLSEMSLSARKITDGHGIQNILMEVVKLYEHSSKP